MVGKNMKVGEKFTDGNREFEVLAIVEPGVYVSKVIRVFTEDNVKVPEVKIPTVDVKKEEPKEEITKADVKKYTKTEINRMSIENLEKLSKELGVEISTGTAMKKNIIEKLGL